MTYFDNDDGFSADDSYHRQGQMESIEDETDIPLMDLILGDLASEGISLGVNFEFINDEEPSNEESSRKEYPNTVVVFEENLTVDPSEGEGEQGKQEFVQAENSEIEEQLLEIEEQLLEIEEQEQQLLEIEEQEQQHSEIEEQQQQHSEIEEQQQQLLEIEEQQQQHSEIEEQQQQHSEIEEQQQQHSEIEEQEQQHSEIEEQEEQISEEILTLLGQQGFKLEYLLDEIKSSRGS